ncbi:ankyrin repeat-containing domain protein [Usnea florida]
MADPLSVSASVAGLITITDAVFSRMFKYGKAVKAAPDEVSSMTLALGSLSGILHHLELVAAQFEGEPFDNTIQVNHVHSCMQTVEKIDKILDKYHASSAGPQKMEKIKRLKWPFSVSEAKALCAEIEQHKTTLSLALNVDGLTAFLQTLSRQKDLQNGIDDIKSEFQRKREVETRIAISTERRKILDWIQPHDPHKSHNMNVNLRHPGTGLWLIESDEFKSWLNCSRAKLWYYGIPGAGKTVLASSAIQEALQRTSPDIAVAFFYCDYKNVATQDPTKIFGSLACQLALQDEQSCVKLQTFYAKHNPPDRPSIGFEHDELRDLLVEMASNFNDVMIIVDALDECGTQNKKVTKLLSSLNGSGKIGNFKTLFFSRDEQEIRDVLEEYDQVSIAAESSDLRLFVGAEIELRIRNKDLRIKDISLKEDVMKRLVEGAQGMFRWVACQMDHLCELPNDAARRKALNTLPPTLHATYERILQRVNRCSKEVQLLVQRSLRWLLCSKQQLTSLALCEAVSIDSGDTNLDRSAMPDEEEILRRCSSLVRRSASGKSLELAHFTVKEFLTTGIDPLDKEYKSYHVRSDICNVELARTCLTYLSFDDDFGSGNRESLEFSYKRFVHFAFREYAVHFWADHAREHLANPDVMSLTQRLLHPSKSPIFVSWTQDCLWSWYPHTLDHHGEKTMTELTTMSPLHFAALLALPEICAWLLQNGCNVDQKSARGTPLECALVGWAAFEEYLVGGYRQYDKERLSYRTTIKLIIDHGADVQRSCLRGPSYLYIAIFLCDELSCIDLLRKGAIIDPESAQLFTDDPTSHSGNPLAHEILKNLSEDDIRPEDRTTLLEAALKSEGLPKDPSLVHRLGGRGVSHLDCLRPFLAAAEYGQFGVLKQLFHDHKLDVDVTAQSDQRSALHLATSNDHIEIVFFLHEHGADINLPDCQGRTPLHASVEKPGRYLCLQFLLEKNVNVHTTDDHGLTAWHLAALQGNVHALSIIRESISENQLCPHLKDNEGRTPLHYAAQSGSRETMIFLLDHGDVDAVHEKSLDGLTALHYGFRVCPLDTDSSHNQDFGALEALLEYSADPASEDLMGKTALVSLVEMWEKFFLELEGRGDNYFHISDGFVDLFSRILENTRNASIFASVCKDPHFLCLALTFGQEELAEEILEYSPPVDAIAYRIFQLSPLQAACYYGRCSRSLLEELQGRSKADHGSGGVVSGLLLFACDGAASSIKQVVTDLLELGSDPNDRSAEYRTAMMLAARGGHVAVVKMLIDHGADISSTDTNGWSVIHYACQSGDEEILYLLKTIIPDWNAKITAKLHDQWCHNATALHLAARLHGPALNFLLTNDLMTDIDSLTHRKETALWMAAFFGISRNVSLLLDRAANDTIRNCNSEGPLHVAVRCGHLGVVETFISKGCDLLLQDGSGFAPQLIARKYGHLEIAELLKERPSDTNTAQTRGTGEEKRSNDSNLFKLAIELGDINMFEGLAKESVGVESGSFDCEGRTPVLYALELGQLGIAENLILRGASVAEAGDGSHFRGWTPFHSAARWGYDQILGVLLGKAPREMVRCCTPLHPIHLAIANGHTECVELIIDHARKIQETLLSDHTCGGCYNLEHLREISVQEPDSLDSWHLTNDSAISQTNLTTARPLHIAAYFGHLEISRFLIDHGASIDGVDDHFWTPLHFAAKEGRTQVAKLLIRSGANVNALNDRLQSPCMIAAVYGSLEPLQALVEGGADLTLLDRHHISTLHFAADWHHWEVVVFLLTNTKGCLLDAEALGGDSPISLLLWYKKPSYSSFILNLAPNPRIYEPRTTNFLSAVAGTNSPTQLRMQLRRLPKALIPKLLAHRELISGTPLYAAATIPAERCIDMLLEAGADLELEGGNHGTPLMGACATGRLEVVKALVRKGAKTSYIKDDQVFSGLTAAKHHVKVRQWLLVGRFMEGPLLIKNGEI